MNFDYSLEPGLVLNKKVEVVNKIELKNIVAIHSRAEDLAKITQASIEAYKEVVNLSEEKLKELMDAETWLSPAECIEMGFATQIVSDSNSTPAQSAQKAIQQILLANQKEVIKNPEPPETTEPAETTNVMFEILKNL